MQQFVGTALKVCEELEIIEQKGTSMVMKFSKIYPLEKMIKITHHAKTYTWYLKNPTAAFMKSVGEINKQEREDNG